MGKVETYEYLAARVAETGDCGIWFNDQPTRPAPISRHKHGKFRHVYYDIYTRSGEFITSFTDSIEAESFVVAYKGNPKFREAFAARIRERREWIALNID